MAKTNGLNTCADCAAPIGSKGSRTVEVAHAAGLILIVVCDTCLRAGSPYSFDAVTAKVLAALDPSACTGFSLDFAPGATFIGRGDPAPSTTSKTWAASPIDAEKLRARARMERGTLIAACDRLKQLHDRRGLSCWRGALGILSAFFTAAIDLGDVALARERAAEIDQFRGPDPEVDAESNAIGARQEEIADEVLARILDAVAP